MKELTKDGTKQIRGFDIKIGLVPETFEELVAYATDNGATLEGEALEAELVEKCILQVFNHSLASNLQTKLAKQLAKSKGLTTGKEDDKDFKDLSALLQAHTLENNFTLEQVQTAFDEMELMASLKPRAVRATNVTRAALTSEITLNLAKGMHDNGVDADTIAASLAGMASEEEIVTILAELDNS
tara:strand:- start:256 stop:810 length:555 start_codon:yes stop_codon:yes gene_type:complete